MSLRTATLLTVILVVGIGVCLTVAVQRVLVYPEFEALEREFAETRAERVRSAIQREALHLGRFCGDYARWDDTWEYMEAGNPEYEKSNLLIETYRESGLSLIAYVRPDGTTLWHRAYELDTGKETTIPGLSIDRWAPNSPLLARTAGASVEGLCPTPAGIFLVSARPVTRTDGSGPVRGTVVMARAVSDDFLRALAAQTGVQFTVHALGDPGLSSAEREDVLTVDKGGGVILHEEEEHIVGLARMSDVTGGPGFVLRTDDPKRIAPRGAAASTAAAICVAAIGLALLGTLLWRLQRTVVAPVARLGAAVDRLAEGGEPEVRSKGWAPAELVRLAEQVDRLHGAWKAVESDLRAAKEAAEKGSRTKSTFLANVSHEVRTPLNGVLGMTHELLASDLSEEQRACAERVRRNAESLLGILNDVLDLSKIEAGRLEIENVPFDLPALVSDVVEAVAARVADAPVEVSLAIGSSVPRRVLGDPTRLRQVLLNLGSNAVKFTPAGEVQIRVSFEAHRGVSSRIRFDVVDTGIGIPENRMDRLFKPFSQVDSSTARRYGGTGLGLAICRELVERMGGSLGVDSREGVGSTFTFSVPFSAPPAVAEARPSADLAGLRVLVAGGAARSRDALAARLTEAGCRAEGVPDTEAALLSLKAAARDGDPFRVLLADQARTGGEGEALGRRVLGDPALPPTHVILLVSCGIRGDAVRLASAGFAGYLTKPVRPWQVVEAVAQVASRTSAPGGDPAGFVTRHTLSESHARGARVLVADDEAVNREVARKTLERLGHSVECVDGGKAAVAAAMEGRFDLVLMDLAMPGTDGFEATEEIRRREESGRRLPILAMTAGIGDDDRARATAAGMDDVVAKPIDPDGLSEAITRWWKPETADEPVADETPRSPSPATRG